MLHAFVLSFKIFLIYSPIFYRRFSPIPLNPFHTTSPQHLTQHPAFEGRCSGKSRQVGLSNSPCYKDRAATRNQIVIWLSRIILGQMRCTYCLFTCCFSDSSFVDVVHLWREPKLPFQEAPMQVTSLGCKMDRV